MRDGLCENEKGVLGTNLVVAKDEIGEELGQLSHGLCIQT